MQLRQAWLSVSSEDARRFDASALVAALLVAENPIGAVGSLSTSSSRSSDDDKKSDSSRSGSGKKGG